MNADVNSRPTSADLPALEIEIEKPYRIRAQPGPRAAHPVHQYYKNHEKGKQCIIRDERRGSDCGHIVSGKNTTNLKRHLERPQKMLELHHVAYADVLEKEKDFRSPESSEPPAKMRIRPNQTKVVDFLNKPYSKENSKQIKMDNALADMILSTSVPLNLVREPSFRQLMKIADSRYMMPWQKRLSKLCDARSNLLFANMRSRFHEARRISICTDIWTKKGMSQSYIGVTSHFFDKRTHKPVRLVLGVRPLPPHSHTAELVKKAVDEILFEWDIDELKTYRIQTDNGSNLVKCFRDFREVLYVRKQIESAKKQGIQSTTASTSNVISYADPNIEVSDDEEDVFNVDENILDISLVENSISDEQEDVADDLSNFDRLDDEFEKTFGEKLHMRCFAHSLQRCLCCLDVDPDFFNLKKNVLRLVNSISHSSRAQQLLIERSGLNIMKPCNTRWNFFSDLLERLLSLKSVVNEVCHELKFDTLRISEWEKAAMYNDLLKSMKKVTDLVEGENYSTVGLVIPAITEMEMELNTLGDRKELEHIADILLKEIRSRFEYITNPYHSSFDPIYVTGTFLDPKFAMVLNKQQIEAAKCEIRRQSTLRFSAEEFEAATVQLPLIRVQIAGATVSQSLEHVQARIRQNRAFQANSVVTLDDVQFEIDKYWEFLTTKEYDGDPIAFWLGKHTAFKILAAIAFEILSVSATSAPIERAFSVAGSVFGNQRHSLSHKVMNQEVLFKMNGFLLTE